MLWGRSELLRESLHSVEIVALGLSIVAIVLAGLSAWYTRSQATWTRHGALESAKQVAIETARHHAERQPKLEASIDDVNGDMNFLRLDVVLASPVQIDGVAVRIRPGQGLRFVPGVLGVPAESDGQAAESYSGTITKYARMSSWRVEAIPGVERQSDITIDVRARVGEETWVSTHQVALP
jgi:hypothetical protein